MVLTKSALRLRVTRREDNHVALRGILDEPQKWNRFYALQFKGDQE